MKYYYKDPLAAAWMQKHFGMRFLNADEGFTTVCGDIDNPHFYFSSAAYIHPDSLHLLEPIVGDIIRSQHTVGTWANSSRESVVITDELLFEYWNLNGKPEILQIIQRNGIAFMWPEVEE